MSSEPKRERPASNDFLLGCIMVLFVVAAFRSWVLHDRLISFLLVLANAAMALICFAVAVVRRRPGEAGSGGSRRDSRADHGGGDG